MTKILVISDNGLPTGYGRIADQVCVRLKKRGYDIFAASLGYDGLLPAQMDGDLLPYWVASLAGKNWAEEVVKLIGPVKPDMLMVIQDAPYLEQVRSAPIDWSQYAMVGITPVDGVPIYPRWVSLLGSLDGAMSISEFGVQAYRKAGVPIELCRPGVDPNVFYPATPDERAAIREKLGLPAGAFLMGTAAMNQGRKAISAMLKAFFAFAVDKPDARYLLDMEPVSPAGWDIPALCEQHGWDASRLLFRADAMRAGLLRLRDRYCAMDAHMVISHREGYGLPLAEAMACGVVSMALDYCSGPEIVGDGRGVLVRAIDYAEPGTWGGAEDRFPDMADLIASLNRLYRQPLERALIAQRGMTWAREQTWDKAADAVQGVIEAALAKRRSWQQPAPVPQPVIAPPPSAQRLELQEAG